MREEHINKTLIRLERKRVTMINKDVWERFKDKDVVENKRRDGKKIRRTINAEKKKL